MPLRPFMRDRLLSSLPEGTWDLVVVGAGINGAGIARDASLRGLRVLVVDKGDVGGGTTSWSTRLIHGGLRYLEHFEVPLVRESLREREVLLRLAPHLVRPLPLLIPIYEEDKRGPLLIRLGMLSYDALSFDKSLEHHHMLGREEALAREPGLNPDGLRGAAVYYDAQVEFPERLSLENALAARDAGAVVLTYARAERLLVEDNVCRGVEVRDLLGGGRHEVRADVTVNVAGPWVDGLLASAGRPAERLIGGTKGSHLVVERFPGAPEEALYVEALEDGRPYFIVPWNGLYLIGTTDRAYEGDLDRVVADDEEVDYLLRETTRVIPGSGLTRDDVLYTYAGVRPLPHVGADEAGAITRRHIVHDHAPDLAAGLLSIVGGKLTTYRNLSEHAVDLVFRKLARRSPPCRTRELPLPGAVPGAFDLFRATFVATSGLPEETARRLLRVYGTRAADVLELAGDDEGLLAPVGDERGTLGAEVPFALRFELAETLTDVLMRRTMIGMGPSAGIGADEAAAELAVRHAGWDAERARREVEAFRAYVERFRPRALRAPGGLRPTPSAA
jgi:glycerol-3-phosphate dehydrogenase